MSSISFVGGSSREPEHAVAGAIVRLFNADRVENGVTADQIESGAWQDNLALLRSGRVDFALVRADQLVGHETELRVVLSLHSHALTILTREQDGSATLADLAGRRVDIGPAGSPMAELAARALAAAGVNVVVSGLPAEDRAQALSDGAIDAMVLLGAHPLPDVRAIDALHGARLIDIDGAAAAAASSDPASRTLTYEPRDSPIAAYGLDAPFSTIGYGFALVARADMPDDIVRMVAESALTRADSLRSLHPALSDIGLDDLGVSTVLPFHDGAVAAFEAAGVPYGTPGTPPGGPGSAVDDSFVEQPGDRLVDGGEGDDAMTYSGERSGYSVTLRDDATVSVVKPDGSTDTLISIERAAFTDGTLLFDIDSANASAAYRLYGGAFDRTPDEGGLRYWIAAIDGGLGLRDAAAGFLASREFIDLYGADLGDTDFVSALYENVLGRPGEPEGRAFWIGYLQEGGARADVLVQFTQLPEFVGISDAALANGFWVA
ncbi:TAXI family TRAP transporter solute-binding subunit [Salinarimonas ramus]|uniref:DUF4214 domain-containing protein n=1 Tax=Salinarimonas ramus TaxID=690164 RepID=A0A917V640_9HYPH|nr:TAXI family TRAP transporter solute-binding subunit [Salinarimonas ramus]GGK42104.1 hypothetical protein GCM10011322_31520 [Salinarimonas ramus]